MNKNITAVAILLGLALVAGAIYTANNQGIATVVSAGDRDLSVKRPGEHVWQYGNKDAPTVIVEFSDFECPFCAKVHPTIKRLVDESGGTIAWQYRHLPLPSHHNAEALAKVSECVGRHLGNVSFWEFTDAIFSAAGKVDTQFMNDTALKLGLNESQISYCLYDDSIREQIELDRATAQALGGSGTPFSVIVRSDGTITPVRGALPYNNWVKLLTESSDE